MLYFLSLLYHFWTILSKIKKSFGVTFGPFSKQFSTKTGKFYAIRLIFELGRSRDWNIYQSLFLVNLSIHLVQKLDILFLTAFESLLNQGCIKWSKMLSANSYLGYVFIKIYFVLQFIPINCTQGRAQYGVPTSYPCYGWNYRHSSTSKKIREKE